MANAAHVVVGPGHEPTLVAATLAATGVSVTLVRTAPDLPPPLRCVERSTWRKPASTGDLGARVYGPTRPAEASASGLFVSGSTHILPLEPFLLGRILPSGHRRTTARSFVRARARNALATVVGGGQEERTYRDWVVRRMGAPAYELLYADYAERRWGRAGEDLSASLARAAHSPALATERVVPADPRDHGAARAEALLSTLDVTVIESGVRRMHVEGKQIASLELEDTFLDTTDSTIWSTWSPARIAKALGPDCPPSARHFAPGLRNQAATRIRLSGASHDVPDEVHVLDPAPCWRLVRAPDDPDHWLVSAAGVLSSATVEDVRDFAVQAGLAAASSTVVAAAELPGGAPVWGPVDHARLRAVFEAWRPLGLRTTGSAGTLTPLDPTDLVAHVEKLLAEGMGALQEAWRTVAGPPTRVDDLDARLTHFFAGT